MQPQRIRPRRTFGDVVLGLAALAALAALLGGVPYALLRFVGPPVAPELLDLDLLTGSVGTSTIVAILVLLVWLAWLQFALCVLVEVYAGVRRVGMPARVPLSGGTQTLANKLVTAALLLFTASAVAVPLVRAGALPPPARPATVAATEQVAPARAERAPCTRSPRPRRCTSCSRRTGGTTRACGRSPRSAWATAAATPRSTSSTSTSFSPTAAGCTWPT
ncbi:hypothetical protein [Thermocatellispora tengchongensis]|uniref:hypothetical protein n=1 Tax=Thermocatellispora tengchongensis TaxID=1073253 RepID=UPI00363BCE62